MTQSLTGYYRLFSEKTNKCFLSPTMALLLRKRIIRPKTNKFKDDVYTWGMVLLQAANLKSV